MNSVFQYITKRALAASLVLTGANVSTVFANEADLAELRRQVSALSEKIAEIEKNQAENDSRYARVTAGPRGFRATSPDGNFDIRVNGLIQLDSRFHLNSEARDRGGNNTFDLRRVRPTIQGSVGDRLDFRFTPELASSVRILDAYGDFKATDNSTVRFGNFKAPVGLERLQGGGNLIFNERGFATEFTSARDLGIQLENVFLENTTRTRIGIFHGAVDGANGAPGTNNNSDFELAGSVFVQPFRNEKDHALNGLGLHLAGSYGNRDGAAAFRLRGPSRLDVANNSAIQEDGNAYRINPGLYYYTGPFGILAEYNLSSRELHLAGGDTSRYDNYGWTIATSYFLTGEKNSYGAIAPANAYGDGGHGAWEIAARYTGIRLDNDLFDDGLLNAQQANKADSYGIGLNWYPTANLKVQTSFEHTRYSGGEATGDRQSDNTILTRLQVAF